MRRIDPPDITNQPDRENIERILAYLDRLEDVPSDAVAALRGLLARTEIAEQRLVTDKHQAAVLTDATMTVRVPSSQRKAFQRQVMLEDVAITCRNCGKTVITKHYPGAFPPSTCSDSCKAEIQRQDTAARQRRFQERRRASNG